MKATLFERIGGRAKLEELLRYFYADVRQHALLAEVFNTIIEDWPTHLVVIADFWSNMTGGPVVYAGPMLGKHVPLGLKEEHFKAWLGLWEHQCRSRLTADCAEEMIALAQQVGSRLKRVTGVTTGGEQTGVIEFRPPGKP